MPKLLLLNWQDIVVWLILGLVIFALLYYISRRLRYLKNIAGKKPKSCATCQNCSSSVQSCAQTEKRKELEN